MSRYLLGVSVLLLAATACKGSSHGVCGGKDLLIEVSGNHGHATRLAAKELERGPGVYRLSGGTHEHFVRLVEATVSKLESGAAVELRSSSQNGHVHDLRLRCER